MRYVDWDPKKNERLRAERDISFDEIVIAINTGKVLDIIQHPKKKKYPGQKLFVINIDGYAYLVPFVVDEEKYFLKTVFPSRKMTRKYIIQKKA